MYESDEKLGVFKEGSIRVGKIKKRINGTYCIFKEDYNGNEYQVNIKKLRRVVSE